MQYNLENDKERELYHVKRAEIKKIHDAYKETKKELEEDGWVLIDSVFDYEMIYSPELYDVRPFFYDINKIKPYSVEGKKLEKSASKMKQRIYEMIDYIKNTGKISDSCKYLNKNVSITKVIEPTAQSINSFENVYRFEDVEVHHYFFKIEEIN